ncbi:MAG: amino acid permease [Gemmatimonadetes bacterium]|nr:amino acid permease [Gemmatimonadota bacterium]
MSERPTLARVLGLWDVVLLNVVAIVGLRWLATAAQMGAQSLVLWALALVLFFVPSGLAVMELATRLPGEGGVYLWTKEAFGNAHGFLAGWAYWVNNLVYYPSILLYLAGVFLFLWGEAAQGFADAPLYNALFSLAVLWIALGLNVVGLGRGKWLQNVGAVGTWLTVLIVAVAGAAVWWRFGSATSFRVAELVPDLANLPTLAFFATMTFGFAGLELAPVLADEIREPERSVPRSILISGVTIVMAYVLGTLAVLVALSPAAVDVITGVPQAVARMGERLGVSGLAEAAALLMTLGGVGGVGAWLGGTARVPFVIGLDRYLPAALARVHPRWRTPHVAIFVQGAFASLFLLLSVAGSTVRDAYLVLLDTTIVVYFIPYLYMFAALPALRRRGTAGEGVLSVPGGRTGVALVSGCGFLATALSVTLALIPPKGTASPWLFELKVVGGTLALLAVGYGFYLRGRRVRGHELATPVRAEAEGER